MDGLSIWHWAVVVLWVAIVVPPFVKFFQRTGRSVWRAIFLLIPLLNIIALWTLAFIRWPALDRESGPTSRI